jgi:hypothetical protein
MPAAPSPIRPTESSFTFTPTSSAMLNRTARTTTEVPCWSSCSTGMSSIADSRSSTRKHSGALMSSSWIAPKVGAIAATVRTISSGSFDRMRWGRR